jgi:hypothetical protein
VRLYRGRLRSENHHFFLTVSINPPVIGGVDNS